jgi:hypothetical protein
MAAPLPANESPKDERVMIMRMVLSPAAACKDQERKCEEKGALGDANGRSPRHLFGSGVVPRR